MLARIRLRVAAASAVWLLFAFALAAKPISAPSVAGYVGPKIAAEPNIDDGRLTEAQFDTTTTPLPPNLPSLGYHAAATSEFGDLVHLAGNAHFIDSVTVTMSSWAIRSDYASAPPWGFTHPITLTLYEVDRTLGDPRPGGVIAAVTTPVLIPWRPEPNSTVPPSELRPWLGADGLLYSGLAFDLTFDLSGLALALPDDVIFSVSFNTSNHGAAPLGLPGPYDALHLAVSVSPPTTGRDFNPGAVYWKTADGQLYADGGAAGVNTFRRDTGWTHYTPAVRFNNSAYGSLVDVLGQLESLSSTEPIAAKNLADARSFVKSALDRTLWDGNRQARPIWGRLVFDLLTEAAEQLSTLAARRDVLALDARENLESIVNVGRLLAETALGDAIIAGGLPRHLAQAQDALDAAATATRPATAVDELGTVWREAQLAVR